MMRPSRKLQQFIAIAAIFAVSLMFFQNCGQVSVTEKLSIVEPPINKNPLKPVGNMCSPEGATFGSPIRVSIILDMSFSNIGTMINDGEFPAHYSKDSSTATDLSGQRISQIRSFIDQCGSSANVSYSIIGFGINALSSPYNSCISPFESQSEALLSIDFFKGMQDHDNNTYGGTANNPFYLQGGTSYKAALDCMEQKVNEDIANNLYVDKPSYYAMMLTDGSPQESISITTAQYIQKVTSIKTAIDQNATSFHFFPIYYGSSEQAATAKATLDELAHVVDPAQNTLDLSGNGLSQIKTKLCEQLKPDSIVQYELKTLYAINMNAVMKQDVLTADTDADGLTDEKEAELGGVIAGFDPNNAHSSGILDSLCLLRGLDKTNCAKLVTNTCKDKPSVFGLRACDVSAASTFFGFKLTGIDSDNDLLPDFIEIIRSTSPSRDDALESPFGDGESNFKKITRGMDVESSAIKWPALDKNLMKIVYRQDAATTACGSGKINYRYEIEQIPLVPVPAYSDNSAAVAATAGPIDFSHGQDENVILVFSVWQAAGGLTLPDRLYVQKILVPLKGEIQYIDKEPKLVGEIAP